MEKYIFFAACLFRSSVFATWAQSGAPLKNWHTVFTSASGDYVFAVAWSSYIYRSTDNGDSFAQLTAPARYWADGGCSDSGQYVVAVVYGGPIYRSSDYGSTWTQTSTSSLKWQRVSSDGTGQYWYAGYEGGVYKSTNYGASWSRLSSAGSGFYDFIRTDSQGLAVYGVARSDGIYYSLNGGGSFSKASLPSNDWKSVYVSASGGLVVVSAGDGALYKSVNYGSSWTSISTAPSIPWIWLDGNSAGDRLVAATSDGLYQSSNSGTTWTLTLSLTTTWFSIAIDGAGVNMYSSVAFSGNPIYKGVFSSTNDGGTVQQCAPYSVSATDSATTNYAVCAVAACPGDRITIESVSGTCVGDQYIRLFSGSTQLSYNDDGGDGVCSKLSYTFSSSGDCDTYELREGCYGSDACSGTFAVNTAASGCLASCVPWHTLTSSVNDLQCCSSGVQCNQGYYWNDVEFSCTAECDIVGEDGSINTCSIDLVGSTMDLCWQNTGNCESMYYCVEEGDQLSVSTAPLSGMCYMSSGGSGSSTSLAIVWIILIAVGGFVMLVALGCWCSSKGKDKDTSYTPTIESPAANIELPPRLPTSAPSPPSYSKATSNKSDESENLATEIAGNLGERVGEEVAKTAGSAVADAVGENVADVVLDFIPFGLGKAAKYAVKYGASHNKK